jgi:hypothetical protein
MDESISAEATVGRIRRTEYIGSRTVIQQKAIRIAPLRNGTNAVSIHLTRTSDLRRVSVEGPILKELSIRLSRGSSATEQNTGVCPSLV